ncbi:hypothetical protein I6F37_10200 [Bradyrhizobium sp. NBAIM08]|uniref:hypothetical protein n=1 Tax=Bradyrhizobium TaxID=374 RepID=UPI001CD28327|nr:hypothetical protein [Bradyrhizobium sp. BRP19]MCA1475393.1 hypothetical protein [Bradyrhizobium sp. NBAIM08]MCA1501146.1 hypothetical protein [Bradyrhizobium sp. NBAIM14]MCA1547116.1 hypothetical protein [Bradyrhizobium sp. BRP19]
MLGQMIDHPRGEAGGVGKRDAGFGDQQVQTHSPPACPMPACKRFKCPDVAAWHGSGSKILLARRLRCKSDTTRIILKALPIPN